MKQTIIPALRYVDARAAIAWLETAFGAERHAVYDMPTDRSRTRRSE